MVYLKTSLLSALARQGFTKHLISSHVYNTASQAGTAPVVQVVKHPKLSLVGNRFQPSFNNGFNANQSGPNGSTSHPTIATACGNDDGTREKDWATLKSVLPARATLRSFQARRYSTGTQLSTEGHDHAGIIESSPPSGLVVDQEIDRVQAQLESEASKQNDVESELTSLLASGDYLSLYARFKELSLLDGRMSTKAYNMLFRAIDRLDQRHSAAFQDAEQKIGVTSLLTFYTEMLGKGVAPDSETYNTVMQVLLRHKFDIKTYEANVAEEQSLPRISTESLALAQTRLERARNEDSLVTALQIFQASISIRKPRYRIYILNELLEACSVSGRTEDAISIYDYFAKTRSSPTAETYQLLVSTFASAKDLAGAIECFEVYKEQASKLPKHQPERVYNALIRSYFACGNSAGALSFFDKMMSSSEQNLPYHCFENVAQGYIAANDLNGAENWIQRMHSDDKFPSPHASTYATLLKAASSRGQFETAKKCFDYIATLATVESFGTSIRNYLVLSLTLNKLDECKRIADLCTKFDLQLPVTVISNYLTALLLALKADDAQRLYQTAVNNRRGYFNKHGLYERSVRQLTNDYLAFLADQRLYTPSIFGSLLRDLLGTALYITDPVLSSLVDVMRNEFEIQDVVKEPGIVMFSIHCMDRNMKFHKFTREQTHFLFQTVKETAFAQTVPIVHAKSIITAAFEEYATEDEKHLLHGLVPQGENLRLQSPNVPTDLIFSRNNPSVDLQQSSRVASAITRNTTPPAELLRTLRETLKSEHYLTGDVILKAVGFMSREKDPRMLAEAYELAKKILPQVVKSSNDTKAAMAKLEDTMIKAYNESGLPEKARESQHVLSQMGYVPSATAFASYVANMEDGDFKDAASEATKIFDEAKAAGVIPTSYLYNTVIAKLAKARRTDEALALFGEMKISGLAPNVVTYGTVINACCRVGYEQLAEQLFAEMEELPRHTGRVAAYNTMIQFYVQTKRDRTKALYYWDKLQKAAILPTAHSYRLLIEAWGTIDPPNVQAAEEVLQIMEKSRVKVESVHHAMLIHIKGCVLHDLESAKTYFEGITTRPTRRVRPDENLYQAYIEAHVANHNISATDQILSQMRTAGLQTTAYVANVLVHGHTLNGDIDKARSIFESLTGKGIYGKEPSSYEAMIRSYLASGQRDSATRLLHTMQQQEYPPAVMQKAAAILG